MNPYDPFNWIHLMGEGVMRNVTIALPTEQVRGFLPPGLSLGEQTLTPEGTHPIIMGFHNMYNLRSSIPGLLPAYTYCEYSFGIPFCYVSYYGSQAPGPYFYMPQLYVDDFMVALGGRMFWGYNKVLAGFGADDTHFSIYGNDGHPILSLRYSLQGEMQGIAHYPEFEAQRAIITQPLISAVPLGVGPLFVIAGFPKNWEAARMQPLHGAVDIHREFVTGLKPGRYPLQGDCPGIDSSPAGGYALHAPFQLGSPYFPLPRVFSQALAA